MATSLPVLRIIGGLLFVLAGLAYYAAFTMPSSIWLVFIIAGVAVLLLAFLGHRVRPGDVAIFVIGLFVLSAVTTPGMTTGGTTPAQQQLTFAANKAQLTAQQLEILASTDTGSIDITYATSGSVGYQIDFKRSAFPSVFLPFVSASASVTNETRAGVFTLNATARSYDIVITIGKGYVASVTATTGTGSVNMRSLGSESLGSISLQTGTGSIDANLTSQSVSSIALQAGTGSIHFASSRMAAAAARVPVSLNAGTGSVYMNMKMQNGTAVSLDAQAGFGSVTQNLQGFSVREASQSKLSATAGDLQAAPRSFVIHANAGTGSVSVSSQFVT